MKIEATTYRREDGLTLQKVSDTEDKWVIRVMWGRAWFYNTTNEQWEIPDRTLHNDFPQCMPFAQAMTLFTSIAKPEGAPSSRKK